VNRPLVGHFRKTWLGRTETFIHEIVSHHVRYEPVVFCEGTENLDEFPAKTIEQIEFPRKLAGFIDANLRIRFNRTPILNRRYRRAARKHNLAILHGHFGWGGIAALPVALRRGLPLATTFYGVDLTARASYARLFKGGSLFLVEGPRMEKALAAIGAPAGKIEIQPIAISADKFPFRARRPGADGKIKALMVGRFVEKKGLPDGIRAFARARREVPDMELDVIGDGPLRGEIERAIEEENLGGAARLHGFVSRDEYREISDGAHIMLVPSRTAADGDTEGGAPTVLLEMQAAGLPVVATRHADIPFVVREGESALLANEGDADGLAAALAEVASHPERWDRMGRAGRAHVEAQHDVAGAITELEARYDRLWENPA